MTHSDHSFSGTVPLVGLTPEWVSAFRIARYRFVAQARDEIHLPPYKGSALRGGFGQALHRVGCMGRSCPCKLGRPCPYTYLFESPACDDQRLPSYNREVPHPFVIEPPLDPRGTYETGERFEFHLALIGRGNEYLPYVVTAFDELGRMGLGKGRGRYLLNGVWGDASQDHVPIFDGVSRRFAHAIEQSWSPPNPVSDDDVEQVHVRFMTPTRLKEKGDLITHLDFPVLIRALRRRIAALAYFHCGTEIPADDQTLLALVDEISTDTQELVWWDWERYSERQRQRMKLGGIVGAVTYKGTLAPFLPLLRLGELVHVGKATSFGNGQYRMTLGEQWKPSSRA